ncbi:LysR family transcriptional regulator [Lactiplantibacillus herbarum]|uniref:LysR family transcriptional regulator n=1 Tax=Lactiplantibacillus herbarum TaxID=1670446 RepID=UPI00064F9805|nr:LysR family transcriptional regulator [Lactiplantibacillus herbarum]
MITIDILKMFITIAQQGSISAAASELGYAQSNLSTKVQQLETAVSAQLFYRTNRGIKLTSPGQTFYEQAIKIVQLTENAINELQHSQTIQGDLHIGTLQTAATTFLPQQLAQFHQTNPDVNLTLTTGTTLASITHVRNYELDGAIIAGNIDDPDLTVLPITTDELCLIAAAGMQPTLTDHDLLVFPTGCSYRQVLERWLDTEHVSLHHAIEFDYLNAIIASVSAGLGISVLPKRVVEPYLATNVIQSFPLPTALATLPVSFVYRQDYVSGPAFKAFIAGLSPAAINNQDS